MIDRQEVMDLAREFSLAPEVIEKDYVLGWLLAGISAHPALADTWVFKGGTCLKKCYFETYRFSEDLDFTLTDASHLDENFLLATFREVAEWVLDQAGVDIPAESLRFEIYANKRGESSGQGRLGYRGPLDRRRGDGPRIKLDITPDEVLVVEPTRRQVNHPYSDAPEGGIHVRCYAFEEVFAEKVRALAERERPRDLYDVVHLYRHDELQPDRAAVLATLERKCAFKRIAVPTYAQLEASPRRAELEAGWENMLGHQLPVLPAFADFWAALPDVFDWLTGVAEKAVRPTHPQASVNVDATWQPPAMGRAWGVSVALETIRFAAANYLCVELEYRRKDNQVNRYLIEPYSLRRSREGNLLLYAVKHDTGEPRSFRVDQMLRSEPTGTSFVPQYRVELTPVGPLSTPPVAARAAAAVRGGISAPVRWQRPRVRRATRRTAPPLATGPRYVFECTVCGKKFTRTSYSGTLNPHKNKDGWPCPGRHGYLVETKY